MKYHIWKMDYVTQTIWLYRFECSFVFSNIIHVDDFVFVGKKYTEFRSHRWYCNRYVENTEGSSACVQYKGGVIVILCTV